MSDERTSPGTLAYQVPDRQRLMSRRLACVALIASAIALAVVGRLLYGRIVPGFLVHLEQVKSQRAVLALDSPGVPIDATSYADSSARPTTSDDARESELIRASERWRSAFSIPRINPAEPYQIVYLGPIANAVGQDRIICLRVSMSDRVDIRRQGFIVDVRDRIGWLSRERPVKMPRSSGNCLPLVRPIHLDRPTIDPSDRKRLILRGTASGRPFAIELALDATDGASCFDLLGSRPIKRVTADDGPLAPMDD